MEEIRVKLGRRTLVRDRRGCIGYCGARYERSLARRMVEEVLRGWARRVADRRAQLERVVQNRWLAPPFVPEIERALKEARDICDCQGAKYATCECHQYSMAEQLIAEGKL